MQTKLEVQFDPTEYTVAVNNVIAENFDVLSEAAMELLAEQGYKYGEGRVLND